MNWLSLDLETTSEEKYKRKANYLYNKILAVGLGTEDEIKTKYIYPEILKIDLEGIDVLVGHNIKFDLLYLWHTEELQTFLKQGGKVWDTQYAEYTLTGQQAKYNALRDIAVNTYSLQERKKHIDDLVFNKETAISKSMLEVPRELVLEDVENDIKDTRAIYLAQLDKAKRLGMITLLEMSMDSILATTEIEYNGIFAHREILNKNKLILEQQLNEYKKELNELIRPYWK